MNNIKILKIGVVVLILLVIGLLGYIYTLTSDRDWFAEADSLAAVAAPKAITVTSPNSRTQDEDSYISVSWKRPTVGTYQRDFVSYEAILRNKFNPSYSGSTGWSSHGDIGSCETYSYEDTSCTMSLERVVDNALPDSYYDNDSESKRLAIKNKIRTGFYVQVRATDSRTEYDDAGNRHFIALGKSPVFKIGVVRAQANAPVITSINSIVDVTGSLDIRGKKFGSKVAIEFYENNGETLIPLSTQYPELASYPTKANGTLITLPIKSNTIDLTSLKNRDGIYILIRTPDNGAIGAPIKVTENIAGDKIQVIKTGALKKLSSGDVQSTFVVRVFAEKNSPAQIAAKNAFTVPLLCKVDPKLTGFNECNPNTVLTGTTQYTAAQVSEGTSTAVSYVVPQGKYFDFIVTTTYDKPTLENGDGLYQAYVSDVMYSDGTQSGKQTLTIGKSGSLWPKNKTNILRLLEK